MVESSTSRTMTFGVGGLAIVFLVAVLTWTVVHQFERQRDVDYAWMPGTGAVVAVTWPLAIGLIVGGFRVMRRASAGRLPGGGSQCRLRGDHLLGDRAAAGCDSCISLRDQARTPVTAARLTTSPRAMVRRQPP